MYEATAPDTPHLGGAQPTWGDLPYGSEILRAYWNADAQDVNEIAERLQSVGERNKVSQLLNLFSEKKLGLLSDNGMLTPHGMWIARNFDPPSQEGLDGSPGIGVKNALSRTEQALFGMVLFERNWVPMLATINVLATESISSGETEARAEAFSTRVAHLDGYQKVNSINSWKKKVQAHLSWAQHLDLAYETTHDTLELTGFGQQLHESLAADYHPDWP